MTREEAIRYFEMKKMDIQRGGSTVCGYNGYDAMCSAVDALREQEERSKGCHRCNTFDKERKLQVNLLADFCPRCGRRLEEV